MVVAAFNEPVAAAPSMTPDTAMNACELNQNNRADGSSHFENVQCRARMRRKALASHSNRPNNLAPAAAATAQAAMAIQMPARAAEHTSELQSLMRISSDVLSSEKKTT